MSYAAALGRAKARDAIARLWLSQRAKGRKLTRSQAWRICARLNRWLPLEKPTEASLRQEVSELFAARHA